MKPYFKLLIFLCIFLFTGSIIYPQTAMGISIKEEEELSKEVLALVYKQYKLVDDPLVVRYINRLGNKILKSLPPQPFKYQFYVIEEDVYNAFATPAGHIFFHSGLLAALGVTRLMRSILFEVSPWDPMTFGSVSLLLLTIAAGACWLPARRAASVDPLEALRYE